jgi:hypothetical protein
MSFDPDYRVEYGQRPSEETTASVQLVGPFLAAARLFAPIDA